MNLSDEDHEAIANKLAEKLNDRVKSFWIDPELHYKSHQRLDTMVRIYDETQGAIRKTLIGMFILGIIMFSSMPFWSKKVGG